MTRTAHAIRETIDAYLADIGVTAEITPGAPPDSPTVGDDDWRRSANPWTLTLTTDEGTADEGVTRFGFWTGSAITDDPTPADILHMLAMDHRHAAMSFREFCDELGYSDTHPADAHDTWQACVDEADKLTDVFSSEEIAQIEEITADL